MSLGRMLILLIYRHLNSSNFPSLFKGSCTEEISVHLRPYIESTEYFCVEDQRYRVAKISTKNQQNTKQNCLMEWENSYIIMAYPVKLVLQKWA